MLESRHKRLTIKLTGGFMFKTKEGKKVQKICGTCRSFRVVDNKFKIFIKKFLGTFMNVDFIKTWGRCKRVERRFIAIYCFRSSDKGCKYYHKPTARKK